MKGAQMRTFRVRKLWIVSFATFQILILTCLCSSFPFSARRVSFDTSFAPCRSSFRSVPSRNAQSVRPTLLVGVFITYRTSTSCLLAFRESFKVARPLVQFNLPYFFVLGNTTLNDNNTNIVSLSIQENMDKGNTLHCFIFAINWFSRQNISKCQNHPLNGCQTAL
jgi:hypothetical protein